MCEASRAQKSKINGLLGQAGAEARQATVERQGAGSGQRHRWQRRLFEGADAASGGMQQVTKSARGMEMAWVALPSRVPPL